MITTHSTIINYIIPCIVNLLNNLKNKVFYFLIEITNAL